MIRLVQRRLIIPRGDTGTFSVPVLSSYNSGDAAVFSIIDPRTHRRVYNQLMYVTDNVLSVKFEHGDTVNLPVGKFLWDIKFYQDPVIEDNQVVSGKEVDSYYAAFTMPECEIRQTGDNMLTADDAPGSTLTPQHINAISAALFALNEAVEKTETNVTHYPTIIDGEWNVWDANLGDYTTTGIEATGNGIASIEKTNTQGLVDTYTVNFTDGTTFLYNITNGNRGIGISSISKGNTSGLVDTYIIAYTDGTSTSFTVTNGTTPNISIGTIQEGPIAAASITGSAANPVLNLTLPNANVPTRVSELENDAGYLSAETDPTVPQWAKQPTKPTYTAQEVGALPSNTYIPEKTSDLTNDSNYAVDANYIHTDNNYTTAEKEKLNSVAAGAEVNVNADWNANSGDAQILNKPTNVSAFTNDAGYLTNETDPTVPTWAKAAQKPTYTAAEVGAPTVAEMQQAIANVNTMKIHICTQGEYNGETGVPTVQNPDTQTFYLVPGGEGSNLFIEWVYVNSAWEKFGSASADINLSNYVQKTDYATNTTAGVIKVNNYGLQMIDNGDRLALQPATIAQIKGQASNYLPIVPTTQHAAVFYGLANAAGDSSQVISNNEIGTYTNNAKIAIQTMLDVPAKNDVPTKVSDLSNDSGYLTSYTETDPTVPAWAKASTKPSYTATEVGALPSNTHIPSTTAELTNDAGFITSAALPTKVSDLTNDAGYLTSHQDISGKANSADLATVATSGDYDDLINKPSIPTVPVQSVNGQTGVVVLNATDVGAGTYSKPSGGIPESDLAVAVQTSLGKADTALQSAPVQSVNGQTGAVVLDAQDIGAYEKPVAGIPKTDLASDVQTSLEKADTALQNAPVTSVNTKTGAVVLTPNDIGAGTYTKPSGGIPASDLAAGVIPTVPVQDVQVNGTSVLTNGTANIPLASYNNVGVVKANMDYGIAIDTSTGDLTTFTAPPSVVKAGTNIYRPIAPAFQGDSVFYGLAKVAGADMASSSNPVGTYTDAAKSAIQHMIGTDTNFAPYESDTTADAAYAISEMFMLNGKLHKATAAIAIGDTFTIGTNCAVVSAAEVFPHDVQVNGTSVVQNGVANVPIASTTTNGVSSVGASFGILVNNNGKLYTYTPSLAEIKAGTQAYKPIVPVNIHNATFYGLAKAAGDATQSSSSNTVGNYTDAAKSAISQMLNGSVAVSGTTPTITALPGIRYVCGEVATLSFTPSATGICDVTFTSGSTATVLTVPNTVKWPAWFNPASLEANVTYEINILDGVYGAVGVWS